MKQKHNHKILNRKTVIAFALLVVSVAALTVVMMERSRPEAVSSVAAKSAVPVKSLFSFTGATDWRKGPSNKTSMVLFHKANGCFTSAEYKPGSVEAAAELQKTQTSLRSDGYTVTPGSVQTLALDMAAGPQQYALHQSSVTTPKGAYKLMGGQEFGYLQLREGYVKIIGYCDTFDELPTTIPALQAIRFEASN